MVNSALASFAKTGKMNFTEEQLKRVRQDFSSCSVNSKQTIQTISDFNNSCGYLLDPHTAVGVRAALDSDNSGVELVCLATAHPAKFGDAVKLATGMEPELPPGLKGLDSLPSRCENMNAELADIRAFVEANAI